MVVLTKFYLIMKFTAVLISCLSLIAFSCNLNRGEEDIQILSGLKLENTVTEKDLDEIKKDIIPELKFPMSKEELDSINSKRESEGKSRIATPCIMPIYKK